MVDALKHSMWNRKIEDGWWYEIFFTLFIHRWENIIIFVCLFRIIDNYFATCRFEIFRFCLRWSSFKNIDQDGYVFNFLSILGKAWCELWHSSHNEILTPLSQWPSSGYFKNHWGLELFFKYHQGSQTVLLLRGTNHFIKHSGVFLPRILFYN